MKNKQNSQEKENKFITKIFGIKVYKDSLKLFGFGLLCFLLGALILLAFPTSDFALIISISFFLPGLLMFGGGIFRLIVPLRTDAKLLLGDDERIIRIRDKAGHITLQIVLAGIFVLATINKFWQLNLTLNDIWLEFVIVQVIIFYTLQFYYKRKGEIL